MDFIDDAAFWAVLAAVAIVAYLVGRMSGAGSPEDRAERRMRERQEAENAFSNMAPSAQQEIDRLIAEGRMLEAIKRFREETGLGLKESRDAIDYRRAAIGQA
ncbi:hypothetical protein [Amphiplicatus metriothermophilus]|uniref:Ribosomal protein L7/L12 C-terminal domain-containing protein n=1 Tax=Amphiplicatus metriothermophilus TaxID=1519374 RepID=A0A239PZ80_9PROT|nr:hypothetical protein [Amphiplicatus metriothermophilus]MBB5518319.1 ribosomal protein L7/L12 [Amphiplicatus metriothermophilus]SNT75574.1 hypothetical protein SAMN06297382_2825 [Amphiplicatus metriothermophilus]